MPTNRRAHSWDVCVWIWPLTIGWDYRGRACGRRKSARRVNGLLMRTSSWMVWAWSCQPTLLVRKVFHSKRTEWQIWLPRKSSQVEIESDNLPHWASAVNVVLLIQPSSAAAEWVFSLPQPRRLFRSAAGCIQDYVETSVMFHYTQCWDNNIDVFEFTTHNN